MDGTSITTSDSASYGWTIKATDGGYHIMNGDKYLYLINDNNGVRVGTTVGVWTLDGNYLKSTDGTNNRWLGVYDNNNGAAVASPNWRAYKNTTGNTKNQVVGFWKLTGSTTPDPDPEEPVTPTGTEYVKATEIADGDKVIIYNAGSGTMMSSAISNHKLTGVAVTPADDKIVTADETVVWTVSVKDGKYTFTQGDKVLGAAQSGTYNNLVTNATQHSAWVLEKGTAAATWYVKNDTYPASSTYGPYYLEYYNGYTIYASNSPSDGQYGVVFYKVPTEPAVPTYTKSELIKDGDKVVIYNAGSGTMMSSAISNHKLTGVAVTPADDKIVTEDETVVWTVSVKDGKYTFTQGDKVLGAAQSGTYNNLVTNATQHSTWVLEKGTAAATWYVKNDTYPASSTYGPYYLEYYNGYTIYASNSPSDGQYGVVFYRLGDALTEEPTPDPDPVVPTGTKATLVTNVADLAEGDELVIVAPGTPAIMGPSAGNYYASVTDGVTLSSDSKTVYFDESKTQTVILGKGTSAGTWSFNASGVYLASVSGSNNHLKNSASLSANSSWTVEIDANGIATIKSKATDSERIWIRYNASSPRFSCYKSGQADVAIYKVEREQYAKLGNTIADGDQFVVYYNKDSKVISHIASGDKLTGVSATPEKDFILVQDDMAVLTAAVDANGYYTFTNAEGKYLTTGATGNNLTFADAASNYSLWTIKAVDGGVHIVSVNAKYNGNAQAIEVYNGLFTTFNEKDNAYYLLNLYKLTNETPSSSDGLPAAGDKVVIYNQNAKGVLAGQDDNTESPSVNNVPAEIKDGKAIPENGAVVFTVSQNGEYYRFYNETYGYLCSNGTGNNAFYSQTASEDADWLVRVCSGNAGGYEMESRTAKYKGYSQWLEYYAGSYKTYSMDPNKVTDYTIYSFFFYGVDSKVNLTGGIVNAPAVVFAPMADAFLGADYTFSFTVDAVFGVEELAVTVNGKAITANEDGTYTVPAADVTGTELTFSVTGKDTKGVSFSSEKKVAVKDEPTIGTVTPAAGSQTGENKKPVISAQIINAGENATVTMTVGGQAVEAVYADGVLTYTPAADMADGRTSVTVTVVRADGKETSKTWSFTVGKAQYALYFGQLHSHTTYSDGSGSLESALDYVKNLPDSANVDFVAFTDHSNYFDASGAANPEGALYDMSLATADSQKLWSEYKDTIAKFNNSQGDVIAIGGFEMTWSGGPGHINTFNTPGIVSRNNTTLNNKTSDAGMKAYYALLSQSAGADSISQFNHPGSTFGTFTDFAYWDALVDTRIQLVEVGNGEGQVGAGGYFPSYEYYTMALDKGWHVAPTNNQDNHKGKWGNANDARDVILTDDFSEEGIYQAIRDMRMYSTEDKNLEIGYSVNGLLLGSIIEEVPEKLDVEVVVYDPDTADSISKVELIVNSGKVAYTWDDPADLADGTLSVTLDPDYSYYYIRVTEGDGDLAVTAPVWVGEMLKLGISGVECGTATPVTDEEVTITTTLFNSESAAATVKSLTYTVDGGKVVGTDTKGYTIPSSGTAAVEFKYTPTAAKVTKVTVTAVVEQDGKEYTFTMDVTLDVQDASKLVYIGIDASHYNEYVAGNYKDNMGNFSQLAAEYSVRTVQLNTGDELIAACANEKFKAIILTAPSRRNGTALRDPYATYSDAEIAALKAFNAAGGTLILTGWGDFYESYAAFPAEDHMAAQQNKVLAALGSSLRISDDETKDDSHNGGQAQRLYLSVYDFDNFLLDGVEYDAEHPYDNMYTELYSQYGGASIYVVDAQGKPTATVPGTVTPAVYGFETTYSADDDKDNFGGLGSTQKYAVGDTQNLMVMATEQLPGQGLIVVAGAAFLSNFEVQATIEDSGAEKNYSNYKICENLLAYINPVTVTDIAEVQAQTEPGYKYTIEGIVTSNASGYDKDTAFFDCIYVQDATGGICCFPVAGNFKVGDKVRVTGTTEFYQGEMELQVTEIELIGEGTVEPKEVTAKQVNDLSVIGQLITVKGTVESFELANGLVQTIMVKDANGDTVRVFIDGYITTDEDVKNLEKGCKITVTGISSYDDTFNAPEGPFPRIRIRDRADIVCTAAAPQTGDNFQMGLWLSLMALTAAAALVLLSRKGKEQF